MTGVLHSRSKARLGLVTQAFVLLFAIASAIQKFAGQQKFPSLLFFLFYGTAIFFLLIYAIGWQQILKRLPLAEAYSHRSMTVLWSLLFGYFFFDEIITLPMLLGATFIIIGVYLVQTDITPLNPEQEDKSL